MLDPGKDSVVGRKHSPATETTFLMPLLFSRASRFGLLLLLLLSSCATRQGKQPPGGETVSSAKSPIPAAGPVSPPPSSSAEVAPDEVVVPTTTPPTDPPPTAPAGPPQLDLRNATFGPIEMGMQKAEVRQLLADMGHKKPQELPMGGDRSLLGINGINFRFTKEDVLYEYYTLNRGVPMEGNLRLGQSSYADYADFLGPDVEVSPRPEGGLKYRFPDSELELLLIPLKEDPDKVFSVLLKRRDLR